MMFVPYNFPNLSQGTSFGLCRTLNDGWLSKSQ